MEMVHFIPPNQRRTVMLAAQTDSAPALIFGASGTGRTALAKWIHLNSARATKPLITLRKEFHFQEVLPQAQGGTVVIAEIGELTLAQQKELLDFINTKSISHPQNKDMKMLLNIRIIASSSMGLDGRAQGGLFNSDLLKKLNVFRIEMPALTQRTDEFEDITLGILSEITRELHKEYIKGLSLSTWQKLKSHEWPGNLRELRNVLKMSVVSAKGDQIEVTDLPDLDGGAIDFRATRESFERIYITELLKTFNWDIDQASQNSKMDKTRLLDKITKLQIEIPTQNG